MISANKLTHEIDVSFARITKDRVVHLSDGDDILFSGRNNYGNTIIGSFYDKDSGIKTYIHNIVSWENAKLYFKGQINYKSVIETSLFSVYYQVNFFESRDYAFLINKTDIEPTHMPLDDSYFFDERLEDEYSTEVGRKIAFQLFGKESETGRIDFKKSNHIERPILNLLNTIQTLPGINDLGTSIHFYSLPRMNGTYQFNYQMDFAFSNPDISKPLTSLLGEQYIDLLLSEERSIIRQAFIDTEAPTTGKFGKMFTTVKQIYDYAGKQYTVSHVVKDLAKKTYDGLESIAELSTEAYRGKAFSGINVFSGNGISLIELGSVKGTDYLNIDENFSDIPALTDDYVDDADYDNFVAEIIAMDRARRTGRLELKTEPFIGQICRFKIEGTNSLVESKFTSSLDHSSDISILAKAKRFRNNRYKIKLLTIQFETS